MLHLTIIVGMIIHVINASKAPSESIIDLYRRINTYGSLSEATSFVSQTQIKLRDINTVRMASYEVRTKQSSLFIRLKKGPSEQIALIELQCQFSEVYVRLGRFSRHRKYRLRRISSSTSPTISYDLTPLLNHFHERPMYLIFNSIQQKPQNLSLFYYSKSNRNLFSLPAIKHAKRRFRRTIISTSSESICAKHEYEIDFNQFSFGQWIIQPKRFNAYACSGSCPNPLSPQYFPSNHAILLSLLRSQRTHGQEPLCVPVQLKPLCLLYYDRDELIIKYHRDMIVQECGCR